jgi:hypothetical protein
MKTAADLRWATLAMMDALCMMMGMWMGRMCG